jgi:hypothetical protein
MSAPRSPLLQTHTFIDLLVRLAVLANHEQPEDRGPRRLDRDPLAKFCELILAFVIANIHWQKLVMHQMSIIGLVPL